MKKKTFILLLALVLLIGVAAGGTLAYLIASTGTVENTFAPSTINLKLHETENGAEVMKRDYKMVPGESLVKDPTVTVIQGSEDCWLFVLLDKKNNFDTYMTFEADTGWTAYYIDSTKAIYYRTVSADEYNNQVFKVLKNDEVTVRPEVTKAQMDALTSGSYPQLVVSAYAIQKSGIATADDAWAQITSP